MNKENKISYSELKNWKECPYRHKLIYVDEMPRFQGNEYTAFGTAIHKACEIGISSPDQDLNLIFVKAFEQEIEKLTSLKIELREDLLEEMRIQSVPICKDVIPAVKSYFGEFKVISVEEELLEDITEFDASGKKFKGFIDLVIQTNDGKYHVIDWKTCSWGWASQKKSDSLTNYQLTYYKNYFSKKHKIDPNLIETYFVLLKRTAKQNNVEILKITSGTRKVENSLNLLERAVINMNRKNYIKNRLSCKYCNFYKTESCT
jgi:ATP-dependent exoDNAse (exonuclease V) beta subunit